jgi:hypothetical protein
LVHEGQQEAESDSRTTSSLRRLHPEILALP